MLGDTFPYHLGTCFTRWKHNERMVAKEYDPKMEALCRGFVKAQIDRQERGFARINELFQPSEAVAGFQLK